MLEEAGAVMLDFQLQPGSAWAGALWGPMLWGVAIAQLVGLVYIGLPAVLAVSREFRVRPLLATYLKLWQRAGGQLVGLIILAVLLRLALTVPTYWMFAAMQAESWSLLGAASYEHYLGIFLSLVVMAATTELAAKALGLEEQQPSRAVTPDSGGSPSVQPVELPSS